MVENSVLKTAKKKHDTQENANENEIELQMNGMDGMKWNESSSISGSLAKQTYFNVFAFY